MDNEHGRYIWQQTLLPLINKTIPTYENSTYNCVLPWTKLDLSYDDIQDVIRYCRQNECGIEIKYRYRWCICGLPQVKVLDTAA